MIPKTHGGRSPRWLGHPRKYQSEALRLFALDRQRTIMPWSYITTTCDVDLCLDVECMILHAPMRLAYPAGVCVYCGMPGGSRDHLLPAPSTGLALRDIVLTVPACRDCNGRINDFPAANVADRRRVAQESIRRNNRALVDRRPRTLAELRQLGPALRSVAVKNDRKAKALRLRLAWPDDPYYDVRAFQKVGIEDPAALGMCDEIATPLVAWKEPA